MPPVWILLIVGALAHITLLWAHFSNMWRAEHFQYFPFAIAAACYVAYTSREDLLATTERDVNANVDDSGMATRDERPTTGSAFVVMAMLCAVWSTLFIAALLSLALTGWISFLLFLATLLYGSYGWRGFRVMLPAFIVLLVIKPLPGFMEQTVTIGMQKVASALASNFLDGLGVIHYKEGVTLVLADHAFMAEEACSGIRSLFSSICAIIVYGVLARYHWFRHLLNVGQTIFWVIVYNALRIVIVILVEDWSDFSVAEGLAHDALSIAVFFLIFTTVLSTNQMMGAIVGPGELAEAIEPTEPIEPNELPAVGFWSQWEKWLRWPAANRLAVIWSICFAMVGALSIRMLFMVPDYKDWYASEKMAAPLQEHLPTEIGPWKVVKFEHVVRPEQHMQGQESFTWQLVSKDRQVIVSLDGTFNEFHDLDWCYSAMGWTCAPYREYSTIQKRAEGNELQDSELTQLTLSRKTGETGVVFFSAIDRGGQIVVPPPKLGQESWRFVQDSIVNGLCFAIGIQTNAGLRATTFSAPVSNIQLVVMPDESLKENELSELRKLFLEVRDRLRKSPRFSNATGGS